MGNVKEGASFLSNEDNDENYFVLNSFFYLATVQSNTDSALALKNDILISEKWKMGEGAAVLSLTLKQLWSLHNSQTRIDFYF